MHIIYVDDEPIQYLRFETELKKLDIVCNCHYFMTAQMALEHCIAHKPDIVFLDIVLENENSLFLAKQLRNRKIPFAFLSAHNDRAKEAFRLGALHYILKPVSVIDLETVLTRLAAIENKNLIRKFERKLNALFEKEHQNTADEKGITIKRGGQIYFLEFDTIAYISRNDTAVRIVNSEGTEYRSSKRFKACERILSTRSDFVRIRQNHFVNRKYVEELGSEDASTIILFKGGFHLELPECNRNEVLDILRGDNECLLAPEESYPVPPTEESENLN